MTDRGVEIRCVVGKPDGWEVVSSRRCCVFEWERSGEGGIIFVDPARHCDACRREVFYYAFERRYRIVERTNR
jgi:hypothetical protein